MNTSIRTSSPEPFTSHFTTPENRNLYLAHLFPELINYYQTLQNMLQNIDLWENLSEKIDFIVSHKTQDITKESLEHLILATKIAANITIDSSHSKGNKEFLTLVYQDMDNSMKELEESLPKNTITYARKKIDIIHKLLQCIQEEYFLPKEEQTLCMAELIASLNLTLEHHKVIALKMITKNT